MSLSLSTVDNYKKYPIFKRVQTVVTIYEWFLETNATGYKKNRY